MKKKSLWILMLLLLGIFLFSCENADMKNADSQTSEQEEEKSPDQKLFEEGVSYGDSGNYVAAIECFAKLPEDSRQYSKAVQVVKKAEGEYRKAVLEQAKKDFEKEDYEPSLALLEAAQAVMKEDRQIDTLYSTVGNSYKVYTERQQLLDTGTAYFNGGDYVSAMEYFLQIPEGCSQYAAAQETLRASMDAYRVGVTEKADGYVQKGEYEVALALLMNAQELSPSDMALKAVYTATYESYKAEICSTAISEADGLVTDGDYRSAIKTIDNATEKIGENEELSAKKTVYFSDFKKNVFAEAETAFKNTGHEEALQVLSGYTDVFSAESDFNAKIEYYKDLAPDYLFELNTFNSTGADKMDYYALYTDQLGNKLTNAISFHGISSLNNIWDEKFYINGKYKTISGCYTTERYGGAYIQIYADNVLIYTGAPAYTDTSPIEFNVDITNAQFVRIYVHYATSTIIGEAKFNKY